MNYNYNNIMRLTCLSATSPARALPSIMLPILIALALCSCSRAEPRIVYGFMDLVYYPNGAQGEERYSFFILPEDDDGVENLSELSLYHDREGLRWLLSSEDWIEYANNEKIWIGSRNIAMPGGGRLPRGQYRAVLTNKGGESSERVFTFDGPETSPHAFPSLEVSGGTYQIESDYPVNRLLCYDQQGKIVQTLEVSGTGGSLGNFRMQGSVSTLALWAEDPSYHISALTEAVSIR